MGHSRMYLLGEVLNSVWHVDFLKYYYFKFYVWKKKGTKSSKLGMAEYRETNVEYGKKKNTVLAFLMTKAFYVFGFFFFFTFMPFLEFWEMPALVLVLMACPSIMNSPWCGPHSPVFSLPAAVVCSLPSWLWRGPVLAVWMRLLYSAISQPGG